MGGQSSELKGPDLTQGVALDDLKEGQPLLGHAVGNPIVLVRRGDEVFAVGATCTHYSGPLAEGLVTGDTINCPWHHACFSLRTGAPSAPALSPIPCYRVERAGGRITVGAALSPPAPAPVTGAPESIVIIGAGCAGNACAEALRRDGYEGSITMIGAETSGPVDRPNLSKDYLAGNAPEEWIPLRAPDFYGEQRIELMLGARVESIDTKARTVGLAGGKKVPYGALLLATGAEPIKLNVPGGERAHLLRSLADSRALIERTKQGAARALVVGASFIGLEVAASLRTRGLEVDVVAPEEKPFIKVLGPAVGDLVHKLHAEKGVRFHLGQTVASIEGKTARLSGGKELETDLVVAGIGVRPALAVAEQAGLALDRGVLVNEYLETSAPGVFAAGDVARFPDRLGRKLRIEHWAVAGRMGQTAAANLLGRKKKFTAVPFFWSAHYDLTLHYVGAGEGYQSIDVHGDVAGRDATVAYRGDKKTLAVLTIGRDLVSLEAAAALERGDEQALAAFGKTR